MEYVKPKVHDETNYYHGIDLNDKKAVQKEFNKRRATHTFFTMIFIAMFFALGVVAFDAYRAIKLGGKPFFAIKKNVDGGKLYEGIGYEALFCDNGDHYVGAMLYQTCNGTEEPPHFDKVLYDGLIRFAEEHEIIDKANFVSLTINEYVFDEKNDKEGSDYILDLSVVCKDNKKCFKMDKDFKDPNNFKVILRMDKFSVIYDLVHFKTSGVYYDELLANYKDKIQKYMVDNKYIDEENLKSFKVALINNPGKYNLRGVQYTDSYLISISFLCKDSSNKCIRPFDMKDDEGDYSNFYYQASVFIDENDEVVLVGPREYLSL